MVAPSVISMSWTAAETPHEGDSGAVPGGGSAWVAEPLAPGALGARPSKDQDDAGRRTELPPLPLAGPLADALSAARAAVEDAERAARHLSTLGPDQRLEGLRQTARLRHVTDAVVLHLLAAFTPEDLTTLGATSPTDLLITHTGADARRAATEVHLARALTAPVSPLSLRPDVAREDEGDDLGILLDAERAAADAVSPARLGGEGLGRLGAQHAAGTVSTDVAALAQRTIASLPARIRRAHAAEADALLAATLPGLTHPQAVTACRTLAHTLDPDRADRGFDPDAVDRRFLDLTVHSDGSVDVRGHLDAVTGAEFKAAIDVLAKPDPTVQAPLADSRDVPLPGLDDDTAGSEGGEGDGRGRRPGVAVRDERSPRQRRADALALLTRQGRDGESTRGGEPARIIVTASQDQLNGAPGAGQATCETTGRALTSTALRHLACSAMLHAVTLSCQGPAAAALALGRTVRLFSPAQRRAMLARDGGCVIPGCTSPPGWWEAHHVHEWAEGGPTDVDQGVLLCGRHHLLVTVGVWQVRMVDGAPQVRPPASVDPLQRWLLNPRRALARSTARRAEQLLLLTTTPTDRAHPHHLSRRAQQHHEHRHSSAGSPHGHGEPPGSPDDPPPDIPSPRRACGC